MATTAVLAGAGADNLEASSSVVGPLDVREADNTPELHSGKKCWGMTDERTLWSRIWQGVAVASLVINLVAMAIVGSVAPVLVAGIVACVVAPIVFYLQFKLQETECKCSGGWIEYGRDTMFRCRRCGSLTHLYGALLNFSFSFTSYADSAKPATSTSESNAFGKQ